MLFDPVDLVANAVREYPGQCRALAVRLDMNATTLAHQLNRTNGAKLAFETACRIAQVTGDERILIGFAANLNKQVIDPPRTEDEGGPDCMSRLAMSTQKHGGLTVNVATALLDGSICDNELAAIRKDCGSAIAGITSLLRSCEERNAANKPGPGGDR